MIPQKPKSRIRIEKNLIRTSELETKKIKIRLKLHSTQYKTNQTSMKEQQNQVPSNACPNQDGKA